VLLIRYGLDGRIHDPVGGDNHAPGFRRQGEGERLVTINGAFGRNAMAELNPAADQLGGP
jgi:hypothetical protein